MDSSTIHDQMGKNGFFWFHGVVEDNNDPLKLGRVRVRCFEYHTQNKEELPTDHLPWATLLMPVTSASVSGKGTSPSGLLEGSWVIGFFRDGNNLQDPIVIGSFHGIPATPATPHLGFNDPNRKWPSKDHLKEPDTNRLSRNESIEKTIVDKKKKNRIVGVRAALNPWLMWNEKETSYGAQYPKNHVIETESGHTLELDDTPGKERVGVYHKAGTWLEIHPDGSKVEKVVGEDNEIVMSDKKMLIKGNCYMNMDGLVTTLKTGRDFYIEIGGNLVIHTKGNVIMETDRNFEHRVHGTYTVASDGPMLFVAPRIDFNPVGIAPSLASSPNLAAGFGAPLLKDTTIPTETLSKIQAASPTSLLNTDIIKNIQSNAFVSSIGNVLQTGALSQLQQATSTLSQTANLSQLAAGANLPISTNALSPLSQNVGGVFDSVATGLKTAVGSPLQQLSSGLDVGAVGQGLNLSSVQQLGIQNLGGPIKGDVGGIMSGLNPSSALQSVSQNIGLPTTLTPTSLLPSGIQNVTNLNAISLPSLGGGLAGSVADTNLVDIAAPAIPTQSLYAVPQGTATLISGYPGRDILSSATNQIPAIPIVAFESEFPPLQTDVTNLNGGIF